MTPGEPLIRWDWVLSHLGDVGQRLGEHLLLTGLAVGIGCLLSLVLAVQIIRRPRLYGPILGAAGVLYTIPSLALFALLVPITGLSLLTAQIGLVSYTLLFLIRNAVDGVRYVPADVREAAIAMGYTPRQLLWRVELPLALPVIIAGIRVATVSTIGLTTVTALIGQGGLGYFILEGLQRFFSTPLIVGAVLSVALAVLADGALVLVQRWATPWARWSA
ncbi:MAG TPA: ABC transporter permease [Chloroflexota bacterium]|nr:ABC transporter permease [Chloroflexota bacterium]